MDTPRFFPNTSLGDVFVFGGAYYEGDAGYGFPLEELLAARYGRPVADVSDGAWLRSDNDSNVDLYSMIDETSPADADYIYTNYASTCEVQITALQDPNKSAGHALEIRLPAGFTPSGQLTVSIRQGSSTEIASWTIASPAADTTYKYFLSAVQADSITDYTDLRVRLVAG